MLDWMEGYLSSHGDDAPLVSARWLVSDATSMSNMDLYVNLERPLDAGELDTLRRWVKRRANGEPLQYITGKTQFRHIDLAVRKGVLIPRPETEVLVSEVLSALPSYRHSSGDTPPDPCLLVADLCTGSGCIACSLVYENPLIKVVATDISKECADLAKENADALDLANRVEVVECDLAEGVDGAYMGRFDAVVSNPPYIPTDVIAGLSYEVISNEPMTALDGGVDGLDIFRRIAKWAAGALAPGGLLAVELYEDSLEEACGFAQSLGYENARIVDDLAGRPRILCAYWPESGS